MDLVRKNPEATTDLQDPDALVSTEQTTQPLLREANGNQERNSRILINDVRPTRCRQQQSNPDIVADIEGLKLDFLILQKQIEDNTRLLSTTNAQKQKVFRSP